ncbi:MAG: hypothetical protein IBJ15_01020 [Alphaproteobacteria bacterium]|nr:hypothetical protein [Alphaproteobacteria bacterium]
MTTNSNYRIHILWFAVAIVAAIGGPIATARLAPPSASVPLQAVPGALYGNAPPAIGPGSVPPYAGPAPIVEDDPGNGDLRGRIAALEKAQAQTVNAIEQLAKLVKTGAASTEVAQATPTSQRTPEEVGSALAKVASDVATGGYAVPVLTPATSTGTSVPTIVALVDARCPYCRAGHGPLKALAAAGRAKVIELPVPLLGPDSGRAALAAYVLAAIDPSLGGAFMSAAYDSPQLVDEAGIKRLVADVLQAAGKTQADYDAAADTGRRAAMAVVQAAQSAEITAVGVPLYTRMDPGPDGKFMLSYGFDTPARLFGDLKLDR